jgi:hypothetical protein
MHAKKVKSRALENAIFEAGPQLIKIVFFVLVGPIYFA